MGEADKLTSMLAELEAERRRRMDAGQWSKGARPTLRAIVDGETLEAAQRRAIYKHLAEYPDAPQSAAAYDWTQRTFLTPKPTVELPGEQFGQPDMVDMTPPPPVRTPPSAPPQPVPIQARSRAGIPPEAIEFQRQRQQRFLDGD
jgi:hypothetical protein